MISSRARLSLTTRKPLKQDSNLRLHTWANPSPVSGPQEPVVNPGEPAVADLPFFAVREIVVDLKVQVHKWVHHQHHILLNGAVAISVIVNNAAWGKKVVVPPPC